MQDSLIANIIVIAGFCWGAIFFLLIVVISDLYIDIRAIRTGQERKGYWHERYVKEGEDLMDRLDAFPISYFLYRIDPKPFEDKQLEALFRRKFKLEIVLWLLCLLAFIAVIIRASFS